jgi:hypothetical protein
MSAHSGNCAAGGLRLDFLRDGLAIDAASAFARQSVRSMVARAVSPSDRVSNPVAEDFQEAHDAAAT